MIKIKILKNITHKLDTKGRMEKYQKQDLISLGLLLLILFKFNVYFISRLIVN